MATVYRNVILLYIMDCNDDHSKRKRVHWSARQRSAKYVMRQRRK